ncbi:MAG: ArsR/SmtB family transcription factor [Campylobacterota bacterium]
MKEFLNSVGAVNDEFRIQVLAFLLRHGTSCVCEIQHALEVKQARLSTALKILTQAEFLKMEKRGRRAYYSIDAQTSLQESLLKEIEQLAITVPPKVDACSL